MALNEYPAQVLAVVRGNAALKALCAEIEKIDMMRAAILTTNGGMIKIADYRIRDAAIEGLTARSKDKRAILADAFYSLYLTALEAERIAELDAEAVVLPDGTLSNNLTLEEIDALPDDDPLDLADFDRGVT